MTGLALLLTPRTLLLASVVATLIIACGVQAFSTPSMPEVTYARAGSSVDSPPPSTELGSIRPLDRFEHAVARPLFNPSRKRAAPPPIPSESVKPVTVTRPFRSPTVLGIAGKGDQRIAVVKVPGEAEARHLRAGDSYDGWKVGRIETDSVVFQLNAETKQVDLVPEKQTSAAPGEGVRRQK